MLRMVQGYPAPCSALVRDRRWGRNIPILQ